MYKEYIELYKTYTRKYGRKTAIFLMVGSFYELYDILDKNTGDTQCNVREVVDYLGIQLSNKKGDFAAHQEGLFAGFPEYALHKWAGRLTSCGWTVVVVDQKKDTKGKVSERNVARILSPSTHIENAISTETPYVMMLYLEHTTQQLTSAPQFGVGLLDLTTGTTQTYTGQAQGRSDLWTADDLIQMMSVFQPKELLVYWKRSHSAMPEEAFFRRSLGLPSTLTLHLRSMETLGAFAKELVRTEYLQKTYAIKSLLPPLAYLGLRSLQEELALLFLLQFVEEHYPAMLQSFHRNEPWLPHMRLVCGNHALTQLQMTGPNPAESVVGLFDKSITAMGKRAMRERLLRPYSNATEISARLREVQEYTMWSEEKTKQLILQLRFMYDLPRLHRKILCGMVSTAELAGLFQTYYAMNQVMQHITVDTLLQQPFTMEEWCSYLAVFRHHISEEKSTTASADQSALSITVYPDVGTMEATIQRLLVQLEELRHTIAAHGGVQNDAVRLEEREREPYGLKGSTITLQQLKKNSGKMPASIQEGFTVTALKSGGWVDCALLQQLNTQLQKARAALAQLVQIHLPDACMAIATKGQNLWTTMEQWVCHVDTTQCIGAVSKERGYTCPVILDEPGQGSSVDIKNVRHPLVEALSTRTAYVKHDVALGTANRTANRTTNSIANGWLVYGMNASGKSTLMKATGICILLAQAGCFVPAKEMTLCPFHSVYTRILNQDNLFAGLSSFAVEMSELRDILRNANEYSLVLGDELCAGTESTSAQALVASGVQWLSTRNAKFIFATHLHDLATLCMDTPSLVKKVAVWHLHVEYDPVTKKLIYDRSLRPGNGSTLYGLEVARAMDLPFEFIEMALEHRRRITGAIKPQEATGSAWNKAVVRKECELCQEVEGLEVHHLVPRVTATHGILADGTAMNDARNLIVICQACHDKIHAGSIEVGETKMTSDGPQREVQSIVEKVHKKSKWTEEELETIMNTLKTYTSMSMKAMKTQLHAKHAIEISESVLGRMKRGAF